ncbi:MAG: helix-turn-helix domain-containing protein [Gemmatimonadaceae bacterium]
MDAGRRSPTGHPKSAGRGDPHSPGHQCFAVGALVVSPESLARVRRALQPWAEVRFCDSGAELLALIAKTYCDAIVVEPRDTSGAPVAPVVREIRRDFPSLPIAAYCPLTPDGAQAIAVFTKAGVDNIILAGGDDLGAAMRGMLALAPKARVTADVLAAVAPLVPPEAVPILTYGLDHADDALTVGGMAKALHVHRRTLGNRLAAAGLPAPHTVLVWCRLLLAARLLEDSGRSADSVALALDFGSGSDFRTALRRYTGLRPLDVRQGGGLRCLLPLFMERLAA